MYTNSPKFKSCYKKLSRSHKLLKRRVKGRLSPSARAAAERSIHNKCIKKLKLKVPLLKTKKSRRNKSPDGSEKGQKRKREDTDLKVSKKCKKWEKIPNEEMDNYDVSIRYCKKCENATSFPYIVHSSGNEEESLDYECYKCGEDVDVRYMCVYCIKS